MRCTCLKSKLLFTAPGGPTVLEPPLKLRQTGNVVVPAGLPEAWQVRQGLPRDPSFTKNLFQNPRGGFLSNLSETKAPNRAPQVEP